METLTSKPATAAKSFISLPEILEHWQGHRRLTRRTIEAFPDDKLFTYSLGGMRPFSELVLEFWEMTFYGIDGIATGKWANIYADGQKIEKARPTTKQELLQLWDEATEKLDSIWPTIRADRFQEGDLAFGMWEGPIHYFVRYFIENEVHHRGQGYVYLRSLGVTPPGFYERF
ncbi:MAG: damage-inducible protein DinB [Chitinophagaceae bacterium]|nr:damage-inducible protein DinB [Chitinophagaceae bacterium]